MLTKSEDRISNCGKYVYSIAFYLATPNPQKSHNSPLTTRHHHHHLRLRMAQSGSRAMHRHQRYYFNDGSAVLYVCS